MKKRGKRLRGKFGVAYWNWRNQKVRSIEVEVPAKDYRYGEQVQVIIVRQRG